MSDVTAIVDTTHEFQINFIGSGERNDGEGARISYGTNTRKPESLSRRGRASPDGTFFSSFPTSAPST
jgi:hypothetical protein